MSIHWGIWNSSKHVAGSRKVAVAFALLLAVSWQPALASGNLAPAAHAGPDHSGSVGQVLGFSANASHDPDGTIVSYLWTFGDGAEASGAYVTHAYSTVGTYNVTLTVVDNQGAEGYDTAHAFICPALQPLLDVAPAGSTLEIQPCTYTEGVTIRKSLTVRGASGVVFDGSLGAPFPRKGPVFRIEADGVTLEGLTFRNWGDWYIEAPFRSDTTLRSLNATGVYGIYLPFTASTLVENSVLSGTYLYGWGSGALTLRNTSIGDLQADRNERLLVSASRTGYFNADMSDGIVERSEIRGNLFAKGALAVEHSRAWTVNLGGGATLRNSELDGCCSSWFTGPVLVERNRFASCCDRHVQGTGAIVRYNDFHSGSLRFLSSSQQSFTYLNNFYSTSVTDDGLDNRFDTGSIGNFWADHVAPDANNDSIRDTPRNISGSAGNADRFPLVSPFASGNASAPPPDFTSAPDALVDAVRGILVPASGLDVGVTYDLTISNLTPVGVGFYGYSYNYGYGIAGTVLDLLRPDGSLASTQLHYADTIHPGRINVSYPHQLLDADGRWTVRANGHVVASFLVSPAFFPPTGAPNPSGPSAIVRAYDAQEMRVSFPAGERIQVQRAYDLTFTNLTSAGGSYALHAPNGAHVASEGSYNDGLHAGRLNVTFDSFNFTTHGLWTLRAPGGATIAAFDVDAPPGVNAFVAGLTLTLGNRTDGAAFAAAPNATGGFDPGLDVAEPPAPADPWHVRLFLPGAGGDLHRSTISSNGTLYWDVAARSSNLSGDAVLQWNASEIAAIDSTYDVELLDGPTTVDMRVFGGHTFPLAGARDLAIRLRQSAGLRLEASAVAVTPVVRVGASLNVSGSVTNDGPQTAVEVTARLELDDGTNITVSTTPSTIVAGGTANFTFPGVTQNVPGHHNATVRVHSSSADSNPANNVVTKPYFVSTHIIDLTILGSATRNASLGQVQTYSILVENEGNAQENFSLEASSPPAGWGANLSAAQVTLAPGASTTVFLDVAAPVSPLADPVANVSVTGIVLSDPSARDVVNTTTTLVVTHGIEILPGWSLLSIPVVPANTSVGAVFGPAALTVYEWTGGSYVPATQVHAGRGYWVFALENATHHVTGTPKRNVTTVLLPGWSLMGTPIVASTLSNAPANVSRTAFAWDGTGYDETTTLAPGAGYWVYSHNATSPITLGAAAAVQISPPKLPLAGEPAEFGLRLRFAAASGERDAVRLGSERGASALLGAEDLPKMPAPATPHALRATSLGLDGERPVALHADVRAPDTHHAWTLGIDRTGIEGALEATWSAEEVAAIPASYRVELQDGPVRVDMRLVDRYTLAAPAAGERHELRVVVSSLAGSPVCAVALNGECVAELPADPTRPFLG